MKVHNTNIDIKKFMNNYKWRYLKPSVLWRRFKTYFHPYNVVHIKTLPRQWSDRDTIMLHAMFQILIDYVEKEEPFELINWESDSEHSASAKDIKYLYDWWKKNHDYDPWNDPVLVKEYDELEAKYGEFASIKEDGEVIFNEAFRENSKKFHQREIEWEREVEENLIKLIKIRGYLWT